MKLIIAGSRNLSVSAVGIVELLDAFGINDVSQVVSGGADGIDKCGELYSQFFVAGEKPAQFIPEREKYGNNAYHIRNKKMAAYGDALLLIWDGSSDGSADMKAAMRELNKPIYEVLMRTYNVVK